MKIKAVHMEDTADVWDKETSTRHVGPIWIHTKYLGWGNTKVHLWAKGVQNMGPLW